MPTHQDIKRGKKILFSLISLLLVLLLIELAFRGVFALRVGPSVLWYGTPWHHKEIDGQQIRESGRQANWKTLYNETSKDRMSMRSVGEHASMQDGYTKYFPHQKRVEFDVESGEMFNVTINNHGFRGRDFSITKESGVIRVVTLGASSTFGYFDKDDETYPVYLENMLNNRVASHRFEVINLGIPHLRSGQILSLFMAEGLELQPDIVTFYEGNNDVAQILGFYRSPTLAFQIRHEINKVGKVSVVFGLLDSLIGSNHLARYPADELEKYTDIITDEFLANISKIHAECAARGIRFFLANQQINSDRYDRSDLRGMSYGEEAEIIRKRLLKQEEIDGMEVRFLAHSTMMGRAREWAAENSVPFVDVIAGLDNDRDTMVSEVHLNAQGNRIVAGEFFKAITARE